MSSVTDSSGNVYVTGYFTGDTNFDPNGSAIKTSTGYLDAYVAKYDASGKFIWVKTWGDPDSEDMGTNIALSGNHVLVYGFYSSTADFNPGGPPDMRTVNGGLDLFLNVFDLDGNRKWTDTWGGSSDEYAGGLGVDAAGNIYMGGTFGSDCDFDPSVGQHIVSAVGWDNFILKFTSSGTFLWVKTWTMGATEDELVDNIATTPSGDIWMCGYFEGTGDFDPDPTKIDQHASLGMKDAWVSRFDSNGNFKWARTWGEAGDDDKAMAVIPDAIGNCYITGCFYNTVDFDPGAGVHEIPSAGGSDAFLLELDPNGSYVWSGTMGGAYEDTGQGVAVDSLGNVLIVGQFENTANVSPTSVQSNRLSNGGTDIFLTKISPSHDFLWADTWGGTDFEYVENDSYFEYGNPLWVDQYGKSYVGGEYGNTVNFNPSGGTDNHTADYYDAFITTIPPTGDW
jgi:hypothetical protein